jgi:hypothetical protein
MYDEASITDPLLDKNLEMVTPGKSITRDKELKNLVVVSVYI